MLTKLQAAEICMNSGCYMTIANGNHQHPISKLMKDKNVLGFYQKYQVYMQEKNGL